MHDMRSSIKFTVLVFRLKSLLYPVVHNIQKIVVIAIHCVG